MEDKECCIPGHEDQKMLIFTHRHWASLLKTIIMVLFFLILPVIILIIVFSFKTSFLQGNVLNFIVVAISLYYMVITTFAFTEWISFYYDILAVTEMEVIQISQSGIFDRKISEISILRVQDVSAEVNGFLATLFGYGDVIVESAGEQTQKYIIKDIPRPNEVASEILKFHNEQVAREERGNEVAVGEGDLRKTSTPIFNHNQVTSEPEKVEYPPQPPVDINNDINNNSGGDISKDDLDKGGEVKF